MGAHRIMSGKPAVRHFSGRSLIRGLIGLAGTLALGTGMCMTMLWGMLVPVSYTHLAQYIQNQLKEDQLTDQMTLKEYMDPLAGNK